MYTFVTIYHCTPTGQLNYRRLLLFLSCMCRLFFSGSLIQAPVRTLEIPEVSPHCDVTAFISKTKPSKRRKVL